MLVVNGREITVRELEVGHWYVFRVAAVDQRGSAGFVDSPIPFRLQTEPITPSPPYNLTAVESTVSVVTSRANHSLAVKCLHYTVVPGYPQ